MVKFGLIRGCFSENYEPEIWIILNREIIKYGPQQFSMSQVMQNVSQDSYLKTVGFSWPSVLKLSPFNALIGQNWKDDAIWQKEGSSYKNYFVWLNTTCDNHSLIFMVVYYGLWTSRYRFLAWFMVKFIGVENRPESLVFLNCLDGKGSYFLSQCHRDRNDGNNHHWGRKMKVVISLADVPNLPALNKKKKKLFGELFNPFYPQDMCSPVLEVIGFFPIWVRAIETW